MYLLGDLPRLLHRTYETAVPFMSMKFVATEVGKTKAEKVNRIPHAPL
ncbi:hypothetical protein SM0020_29855 [Sinorhizobium meliloti CCNWSX0020]|uniref:Uncharacterized protein n=1 Tax=Sinorhizobium meliloti CCNWSX0020 TaxID=1107881 RepID=H0G8X8_RHIML|nr:hypothetical protein SM0020_29855 [Sinorhizobium meliloti CCNWSX0020]PII38088.1 hypothetical protein T190_26735 [Sinorhizobium meliloti CCBAU 01290]